MDALPITIFADFSCPYSYLTESALRRIEVPRITIRSRAFELFPEPEPLEPARVPAADEPALTELARAEGMEIHPVDFRPRTAKAHEAARFARDLDPAKEAALRAEIYAAYWREGHDIGRIDVLMDLAERVGLDPVDLKIALDIDRWANAVAEDRIVGERLRIPGTPTIFIGLGPQARIVTGAHGFQALSTAIADAFAFFDVENGNV